MGASAVVFLLSKKNDRDAECHVISLLIPLPLLSVINCFVFLIWGELPGRLPDGFLYSLITSFMMLGCCAPCILLRARYVKVKGLRIVMYTVPFALLLIFASLAFTASFGVSLGKTEVTQTVYSPDGKHYAEVINADGGATGGDTLVRVYRAGILDLGFIRIASAFDTVYTGEWYEYMEIRIEWKDNETLLINGEEYSAE